MFPNAYRPRGRHAQPLALVPTQIATNNYHPHVNGVSGPWIPNVTTTPLPIPLYGTITPNATIHPNPLALAQQQIPPTPTGSSVTMGRKQPNGHTKGQGEAVEEAYHLPDGWVVPIHREWTRGDFILVCQPAPNAAGVGYRVNVNILINASMWFKDQILSPGPSEYSPPTLNRSHILIHEPLEVAELMLRFLHLGREGVDASTLRPTVNQYFLLYHVYVRLQFKASACQILKHHADSYAGDLVESVGRTASKEAVFALLDLARVLRCAGIWNAVLDSDFTSNGWEIIHNPWDLEFNDAYNFNESFNVLLLLQRLSTIDDAPLHEFRVGYDSQDRPFVFHQDNEAAKFSAV